MIPPEIINVICPHCTCTWMNKDIEGEYFCIHCGYALTEEGAKVAAWASKSPYYGE